MAWSLLAMAHGMKMGYPRFSHSFVNGAWVSLWTFTPVAEVVPKFPGFTWIPPIYGWRNGPWSFQLRYCHCGDIASSSRLRTLSIVIAVAIYGLFQILGEYSQMAFVTWKNEDPPYGFGFFPRFSDKHPGFSNRHRENGWLMTIHMGITSHLLAAHMNS